MKKYFVRIHYEGCVEVEVPAESEIGAIAAATQKVDTMKPKTFLERLCPDFEIEDVYEI